MAISSDLGSTDVGIENLVFFTKWLQGNDTQYELENTLDLTALTLNGQDRVRLCYKWVLSLSDLQADDTSRK